TKKNVYIAKNRKSYLSFYLQIDFILKNYFYLALFALIVSCTSKGHEESKTAVPTAINPTLDFQPNILWLVAEDISPYLPMFGDSTIATPNLSWLATEGVCYDNVFSPAPVCAPARAAIATGIYPTRMGANHMRTGPWYISDLPPEILERVKKYLPEGLIPYETQPSPAVKMMSEYLRMEGYYCTNNFKEDYQFIKPVTAWDESSKTAHWRNRKGDRPFFSVFNFEVTHESRIWAKAKDSLWVDDNLEVSIPPYLPDTDLVKKDVRRLYSNIKEMDAQVGEILQQLKDDGLLEKTIIVWYSDHGGPLPRQKRLLYDSGLKVPMIIRFPNQQFAGQRDDQLISFIDFAPTTLSLAGIEPDNHFDGTAFLGPFAREKASPYIFAATDRFDATTDQNRAVRDRRFKYIKYHYPEKSRFVYSKYRDQMATMQELYRLQKEGNLTPTQALWFRQAKPAEELFDTQNDPHEINNLADDPAYEQKLVELRQAYDEWSKDVPDLNRQPEPELIEQFWPNQQQPVTEAPQVVMENGKMTIQCPTEGASIGYQLVDGEDAATKHDWQVYQNPVSPQAGKTLVVVAHRIGFLPSGNQRIVTDEMLN
ncbi:MAG: sulfatase, partial [Bacteroidota bacterium]